MLRLGELAADPRTRKLSAPEIHARLCAQFPSEDPDDPSISLRTVQTKWPGLLRSDSKLWTLETTETEPEFLLRLLLESPDHSLTVRQVEWARVIHRARPDLGPKAVLNAVAFKMAAEAIDSRLFSAQIDYLLAGRLEISTDSVSAADPGNFPGLVENVGKGGRR